MKTARPILYSTLSATSTLHASGRHLRSEPISVKTFIAKLSSFFLLALGALTFSSCSFDENFSTHVPSVNSRELAAESRVALNQLCQQNPHARKLRSEALGVLVFPNVVRAGMMVGAKNGNGALVRPDGSIREFYQTNGASYGLQVGVQQFSYALFLMDRSAFDNLNRADGWAIGSSPTLVIVDQGMSGGMTTTTLNNQTYAFFFNQRGLMAGLGLHGTRITRLRTSP